MKVLVVGGGGREHALCWKIFSSPLVREMYCAPGNAGIASLAECIPIKAESVGELLAFAEERRIDLTVVGPEAPLTMGIADRFRAKGLLIAGPSAGAAMLEGSKAFAKDVMRSAGVPTARCEVFSDAAKAEDYAKSLAGPSVVKADGLAAGKGVIMCCGREDALAAVKMIMRDGAFGEAGSKVVIEEMLEGEEASFIAITDGEKIIPLASSQDHKRVFDGDQGPNTGGMGAYSPAPVVDAGIHEAAMEKVMLPVVREMASRGLKYSGFLYGGLMIDGGVPKVLEFNARLGDPETQPLMLRMKSDIVPYLVQIAEGSLKSGPLEWDERPAVCVVIAARGYPGDYSKGIEIGGLEEAAKVKDAFVFHAGTSLKDGKVTSSGGRVLGVTAMGDGYRGAISRAYEAASRIRFEGGHYRCDIGRRALDR